MSIRTSKGETGAKADVKELRDEVAGAAEASPDPTSDAAIKSARRDMVISRVVAGPVVVGGTAAALGCPTLPLLFPAVLGCPALPGRSTSHLKPTKHLKHMTVPSLLG